jgi:signal transduction histidine kinase
VGAIRECATGYSAPHGEWSSRLRIGVAAPRRLPQLSAAVEVAAYRIVQEALTNVLRHARASSCHVELSLDSALHLSIADDGIGLPTGVRAGVGLASMRERAEELGGRCVIESTPSSGTRVRADLPLPAGTDLHDAAQPAPTTV